MTASFVAGLLAGYGIALPVGAVAAYLVALTARNSLKVGAAAALGVASADGLYALVAVLGGASVAALIQPIGGTLRIVAAVVLIVLAGVGAMRAIRDFRSEVDTRAVKPLTVPKAYFSLLGITVLNPATVIYFAALVMGDKAQSANATVFVIAAFLASASWQLTIACGGAVLGRLLTGHKGRLITALTSSAVIAGLAVQMVV